MENINSEKDLGALIDDSLKFPPQTAAATKKANQILGVIKRTYQTRDTYTISTLYKSIFALGDDFATSNLYTTVALTTFNLCFL